jgi:NTP pyrophosphatase (non-canonical NTP hydrolase)
MVDDRLAIMFERQSELMDRLGVSNSAQFSPLFSRASFEAAIGMVSESAEVLDVMNTNSKPWKQLPTDKTLDRLKDEIVDVLFYSFELAILVFGNDASEILFDQFMAKQEVVRLRVQGVKDEKPQPTNEVTSNS